MENADIYENRNEQEKLLLDTHTLFEAPRTRVVNNYLKYYSKDTLEPEFEASGFGHKIYTPTQPAKPSQLTWPELFGSHRKLKKAG